MSIAVLKFFVDCRVTIADSARLAKQASKPIYQVLRIFILKQWLDIETVNELMSYSISETCLSLLPSVFVMIPRVWNRRSASHFRVG